MNRIRSVDIFRLIAIMAVVAIHVRPFHGDFDQGLYTQSENVIYNYFFIIINQGARFAIPFFFTISGYFWGAKVRIDNNLIPSTQKMAKRIFLILLAWCFIYLLPYNFGAVFYYEELNPITFALLHINKLFQDPVDLIMKGTQYHLWFLVSLLFSLGICAIFIQKKWIKSLVALSLLLYIIGIFAGSYAKTPIGLDFDFNTRYGPFFGTVFFASGYLMSGIKINTDWLIYGGFLFCFGWMVHFAEIFYLWKIYSTDPQHDYVFGTFFMGIGVAMAALSNHPALQYRALSKLGQITLGIYAIHVIYVDLFKAIDQHVISPYWEVGYGILVFIFSALTALILSRNRITKKLVV